ncbi:hypothetical protein AKJ16_DCAP00485 [Drosera capensis]
MQPKIANINSLNPPQVTDVSNHVDAPREEPFEQGSLLLACISILCKGSLHYGINAAGSSHNVFLWQHIYGSLKEIIQTALTCCKWQWHS